MEKYSEVSYVLEEVEDNVLRAVEERKKSRLRTRGPYRKAHVEIEKSV